jgi:hypothetical protein
MYINKIDELIDNIIDDFYNSVFVKKTDFTKILSEVNFVKYQLEVNKILINYTDTINKKEINDIVQNTDNVVTIIEIIKRYISYYTFLMVGAFFKGKRETYVNNVIEFSKNQPSFNFKVNNFFNSENNSNVFKFFTMVKNTVALLEADKSKLELFIKNPDFKDTIKFLNEFGQEYVNNNFKLENVGGNVKEQSHNIIKTLLLDELYFKQDKKNVFEILEAAEKEKGVYTFIDIVVPKKDFIDYSSIEQALTKTDVERGLASELYDFILSYDDLEKTKQKSTDQKILDLIDNRILVPITEDFLLYHKDTEKYERAVPDQQKYKKKEDTKIRYIVSKIDSVSEYFSNATKNNPTLKKSIDKHFYAPLSDVRAVLINNNEEIQIINKLHNQGKKSIENNEYYNDLVSFRMYPYINFKDFQKYGFDLNMMKTTDSIRSISFEKMRENSILRKNNLQMRVGSGGSKLHITGFVIPTSVVPIQCITGGDIYNIRSLGHRKRGGKKSYFTNGYDGTLQFLKHILFNKRKLGSSIYWQIDIEKDRTASINYEQTSKLTNQEHSKLIVSRMYDDLLKMMYRKLYHSISKRKDISLYDFDRLVRGLEAQVFEFSRESELYEKLENLVYGKKYQKTEKKYDEREDTFLGLSGDIIKLPESPAVPKEKIKTIKISAETVTEKEEKVDLTIAEKVGAICQHNITWEKIMAIRKKNPNKFTTLLYEFILQYVVANYEEDFVCKSCGTLINVKNYVPDGAHNEDGQFVSFYDHMDVPLEDVPEYEKYIITIRNLEKMVDRLSSVGNVHFLMDKRIHTTKVAIKRIIKSTIDLLNIHSKNMEKIYKNRNENMIQKYGIDKELTNLFFFELENNIFIYSSKDKDYYKPIKRNNILTCVLFLILMEYSDTQTIFASGDRTCNYYLFSKYGFNLFADLKIIKNNANELTSIQNYKVLCYLIFYFSCLITKYNMWHQEITTETSSATSPQKPQPRKFNPLIQKSIIHTLVDFINSVLEISSDEKKRKTQRLYEVISVKFFQRLDGLYAKDELLKRIKKLDEKKVVKEGTKIVFKTSTIKSITLPDKYSIGDYQGISLWNSEYMCRIAK